VTVLLVLLQVLVGKKETNWNQTILFHVNLHDDFLGHGLCRSVYRTKFDEDSVALKVTDAKNPKALADILNYVKIYSFLKELEDTFIPYFLWNGFLNRGEYYYDVTSLGNPNCVLTDSE
jgi:hypothetical protein